MNKGSKLKAGWLSILRNEKQWMVDARNANNLGRICAAIHNQVNDKDSSQKHSECVPPACARMGKLSKILFHASIASHLTFEASPSRRTLQSAIPAAPEGIRDFESAKQDGETKLKELMGEPLYSKEKSINDRIKNNSRLTFAKEGS